jgi:phosphoribosylformylglycinamidine synthase subunit PurS
MKFIAEINIMPLKVLPDPQSSAVESMLAQNYQVKNLRIGKHIKLEVEAAGKEEALDKVNHICQATLSNSLTEGYEYSLKNIL